MPQVSEVSALPVIDQTQMGALPEIPRGEFEVQISPDVLAKLPWQKSLHGVCLLKAILTVIARQGPEWTAIPTAKVQEQLRLTRNYKLFGHNSWAVRRWLFKFANKGYIKLVELNGHMYIVPAAALAELLAEHDKTKGNPILVARNPRRTA